MANVGYNDAGLSDVDGRAGMGPVVTLLGGVVSLAMIGGMAVWGYQLLMRDVTGVPVIQALQGEMRVAPSDPGGERAAHQGLAVNEVAAVGGQETRPASVILAPAPVDLGADDLPRAELEASAGSGTDTPPADEAAAARPAVGPQVGISDTPQDALATDMAVAEALTTPLGTEALADALSAGAEKIELAAAGTQAVLPGSVAGVVRSPRPAARPARADRRPVVATPAPAVEVEASTVPEGTRLVQLGAYESAEVARNQWQYIQGRFGEYFEGKQRVVQAAESGGKTFYRLRAMGFDDLSDARRFCSALMAQQADCIPVVVR